MTARPYRWIPDRKSGRFVLFTCLPWVPSIAIERDPGARVLPHIKRHAPYRLWVDGRVIESGRLRALKRHAERLLHEGSP